MRKKLLLLLVCSMTAVWGFAQATSGTCGDNVTWNFDSSTGTLTISGTGAMENYGLFNAPWYGYQIKQVEIEYGVTSIGDEAFKFCYGLTSITIPNSVTNIGDAAFTDCNGLISITIPNSVTSIGNFAFSDCSGLTSITIPNSVTSIGNNAFDNCYSLTSITIPNSVMSIGYSAFSFCSSLTSIIIPSNLTSISDYVFFGCNGLTSVTIPSDVTSIGNSAFSGCSSLTSITIPNSVTSINEQAFSNCNNLTSFEVENANPSYSSENGILFNKAKTVLIQFPANKSEIYTIPSGVTSIGNYAFFSCSGLISVTIPSGVTSIGNYAFSGCSGLTSVTIPSGVTSIGNYAFSGCSGLTSVTISSGVRSIGNYAFSGCSGLTSFIIPSVVRSIGEYAFSGCSGLTSVIIPNSVTNIGGGAFYNCSGLTSISIGNNVTNIGSDAFTGCSSLISITVPNSVTSIGNYVFSNCSGLTELTLPFIGVSTTATGNFSLLGILFGTDSNSNMQQVRQYHTNSLYTDYYLPKNLRKITITEPCSKINYGAFYNCTMLEEIVLPGSLTSIAAYAFYNCSKLAGIIIPNSVTSIESNIFSGCPLTEVTTPIAQTGLGLFPASLQKLTVTSACTSISAGALSACTNLKELTLPFIGTSVTDNTVLGVLFGTTASGGVRQYDEEGGSLQRYAIPGTLHKLIVTRPIKNLSYGVLYNCVMIDTLDLASSLAGVGKEALSGCTGLKDIFARGAEPASCYSNTFDGIRTSSIRLHIPEGSLNDYQKATGWKDFFLVEEAPLKITALPVPIQGGIIKNNKTEYDYDDICSIEAGAHSDYTFKCWMEDESIVSVDPTYSFTVTAPRTLYAVFTPKENADENIQIQAQARSASISWVAVEDAANYTLVIYSDESRTNVIATFQLDANGNVLRNTTRDLSCTIPDLNLATTYYYSLTSYDVNNYTLTISNGNFSTTNETGIDNLFAGNQLRIYPNPVSESFRISGLTEPTGITISDISGKVVLQGMVTFDEPISVQHLPNGMYIVRLEGKMMKMIKR